MVAISRFSLNIFLNCFIGPIKKHVLRGKRNCIYVFTADKTPNNTVDTQDIFMSKMALT